MYLELEGWDTIISVYDILHISVFEGSHKFVEQKRYTLFSSKTEYVSELEKPQLRIWYKNDKTPFTFTARGHEKYESYRKVDYYTKHSSQLAIDKLLKEHYESLVELKESIKKALHVYENEEEDQTEVTETVY